MGKSYIELGLTARVMPGILDDPRRVSRVDAGDMLGSIFRMADPFLDVHRFKSRFAAKAIGVDGLLFVGMGGSASAGDVLVDWLGARFKFPVAVSRGPNLPRWASRKTLVVFLSYSGGTWETLAALREAVRISCPVVGVGSGGGLMRSLESKHFPFFQVSQGLAPRAALGEMIVAATMGLQSSGVVGSLDRSLVEAGEELSMLREKLAPGVPVSNNRAKKLAQSLFNTLPIVYAFSSMGSVARRFKNQLAENAKVVAKYGLLPEACHNEIEGFDGRGRLAPVIVRDRVESLIETRVMRAFVSTLRDLRGLRVLEVREKADSRLGRLLAPILLLDYVSAYLAVLGGVDPSPTPGILEYKRRYAGPG